MKSPIEGPSSHEKKILATSVLLFLSGKLRKGELLAAGKNQLKMSDAQAGFARRAERRR